MLLVWGFYIRSDKKDVMFYSESLVLKQFLISNKKNFQSTRTFQSTIYECIKMRWNQYLLSYAYNLWNITQQMCEKFEIYVDNHAFYQQKRFKWYSTVHTCTCNPAQSPLSSVTFHNVIVFHCYSLYLRHFWLSTQKSYTNLNNIFYMNIKFDKLVSEIDNVYKKASLT